MDGPSFVGRLQILLFVLPLLLQVQPVASQYAARSRGNLTMRAEAQTSNSRDIYIAGHDDFCIFGPASPGSALSQDRNVVSWCNKAGHNTRVMPEGTLKGVTYIKAKNWVQVSGVGDFTKINVKSNDWGAQFDSRDHKPEGAKVMGGSDKKEASNWVTLMSPDTFCFRACFGDASYCPTNFADKGCYVLLSNAVGFEGTFQSCTSEDGLPPAQQGDKAPDWVGCSSDGKVAGDKVDDKPSPTSTPSTSWVGVPTCIPCTGASSSTTAPTSAISTSASSGTIQQGMTKVDGLVAGETMATFISAPAAKSSTIASGALILKRAEETITKDGQCCFTTWTPSVVGAGGAGPTSTASVTTGGTITGVQPSNVTNTALITNMSDGAKSGGAKPSGNATVSGGGKNGTNSTGGNGSESLAVRGMDAVGMSWGARGLIVVVLSALAGGWAVL